MSRDNVGWGAPCIHGELLILGIEISQATGRQMLTLYVAHIYIGMSILDVMGLFEGHAANTVQFASLIFCILSAIYAFCISWIFRTLTISYRILSD
ncbi:MAG: hypothetical protein AB8B97_12655 [Granulosicoccus sp.]